MHQRISPLSTQYRPEIDGLRALAVLPVILFHAGLPGFSGGYIGVDVFFVISGYLIASILAADLEAGRFSLWRFYERRARRILPALFLVCATCLPFAWLWLMPDALKNFAQSLAAVALFASNFLFYQESGYFAAAAETKPLLHSWSLAVEEQFYILFPLLLAGLWRLGPRATAGSLLILAAASLGTAAWLLRGDPAAAFYLLPSRAWEILAGALAALWLRRRPPPGAGTPAAGALALAGLGAIAVAVLLFDPVSGVPGPAALLPVVGALLVILYATPGCLAQRLLSWHALVGLGLISYSAYLWHWPLMVFTRQRLLTEPSPVLLTALGLLALPLAWLTWRYVEQPFRHGFRLPRAQIFAAAGAGAAACFGLGLIGHLGSGFPDRVDPEVFAIAAVAEGHNPNQKRCLSGPKRYLPPAQACTLGDPDGVVGVLWGDSHADAVAPALGTALRARGIGLKHLWYSGCPPAVGVRRYDRAVRCADYNDEALRTILADPGLRNVVLVARFTAYLEIDGFDNREGGVEKVVPTVFDDRRHGEAARPPQQRSDAIAALYLDTIERLLRAGKRVVLVYPIPEVGWNVPDYAAKRRRYHGAGGEVTTSYAVFQQRNAATLALFDSLGTRANLARVLPHEIFCDSFVPGRCTATLDGWPLYRDDDHLSDYGAGFLAGPIVDAIEAE